MEPGEVWLLDAYFDLSTCRGIDGNIPWLAIVEYGDRAGLEPDVARSFCRIMRLVDNEKLRRHRANKETPHGMEETSIRTDNMMEHVVAPGAAGKESMRAMAELRARKGKK